MLIPLSNLLNSSFAVQSLSNCLVGLHKLVELLGELLILDSNDSNVVVQGINLHLQIRIVVQKGRVAVSCSLELLSHVHDLVLLGSDLALKLLDGGCQLHVSRAFRIDSLLEVCVLMPVLLFKIFQVV